MEELGMVAGLSQAQGQEQTCLQQRLYLISVWVFTVASAAQTASYIRPWEQELMAHLK